MTVSNPSRVRLGLAALALSSRAGGISTRIYTLFMTVPTRLPPLLTIHLRSITRPLTDLTRPF